MFVSPVLAADPMASNNGLYPTADDYSGTFRVANLNYPDGSIRGAWIPGAGGGPLTVETAEAYTLALKEFIAPTIQPLIEDSQNWDAEANGWYDLVWSGEGSQLSDGSVDPTSGREALSNTYTGQILPADTFSGPEQPSVPVQNHAVIYYNDVAAGMLGEAFANIYNPDPSQIIFPDGSIVVKAEAATPTPQEWPLLEGAATWNVFRPTTQDQNDGVTPLVPQVLTVRPLQMSIKIKDRVASPETGWVYMGFVYDTRINADSPWGRFIPIGAMWGNDPAFAQDPNGLPDGAVLQETWVNPDVPDFVRDTLGWGGRLAGPMDVATRHNVITPSGKRYQGADHLRASSCMSCHGAAEFPFTANLYPSPNRSFPPDGQQFLLYDPGSSDWARWFQNRDGTEAMSDNIGGQGLDYDMAIMFALSAFNAAVGNDGFVQERFDVH